jgi:hypothetical protein
MHFTIGLFVTKSVEKGRSLPAQKGQRLPLDRYLQGSPDQPDLVRCLARPDDDMNVFGHDDVGPQGEIVTAPGGLESLKHPATGSIPIQERQTAEAGKGQFMSVSRLIVTADLFPMWLVH